MGTWHMHVEGSGVHDNVGPVADDVDAEKLFKKFVGVLAQQGHKISRAEFTLTGQQRELTPLPSTDLPLKYKELPR